MAAGELEQPGWDRRRLLGALLCLVASVAAFTAPFLTLYSSGVLSVTGWGAEPSSTGVARNGFPLAVAGALLAVAALFAVVAAPRPAPAVVRWAAVLAAAVAAAFLAGVLVTAAAQTVRATPGPGFWLVLAAAVLALAGTVLAALPAEGRVKAT
ncbi:MULTISPECIES: hypothetical protein [Amycolatopsis]|uniref:Tryptophan-associated transmembrane protein (Trp_oprn_chp) n=2 Tax=Amycolatopsis TaxID=1813 RepID=A0A1I3NWA9_9PSEU|nr:hypothetical protein [Amycolatopsis sacchari]SFJ13563.1 hypothetical protein SAMN05421835_103183 [Amycolatopsis sacchari]